MSSEIEPREVKKRYFSPITAAMLEWMVFNYDEWVPGNPYKKLANDQGINVLQVDQKLKELEKIGKCDRTKAVTMAVKIAVSNGEIDNERITKSPTSELSGPESVLVYEFVKGSTKSQICENMNLSLDEMKTLNTKLMKKFNTRSRFLIVAWDTIQKLKS